MVIVRPLPEIARDVPDWLRLHVEGKFKDGAVSEETFSMFMEPTSDQITVTDSWRVPSHTVILYIEEETCWALAARMETVYTAYIKGLPIRVVGDYALRDLELIDEILYRFHTMMTEAGHDLATLFGGGA